VFGEDLVRLLQESNSMLAMEDLQKRGGVNWDGDLFAGSAGRSQARPSALAAFSPAGESIASLSGQQLFFSGLSHALHSPPALASVHGSGDSTSLSPKSKRQKLVQDVVDASLDFASSGSGGGKSFGQAAWLPLFFTSYLSGQRKGGGAGLFYGKRRGGSSSAVQAVTAASVRGFGRKRGVRGKS